MKICFYTEGHIGDLLNPLPVIDILIKKYPDNEYYFYDKGGQSTQLNHDLITIVDNLIPSNTINGDINIPTWPCNSEYKQFNDPPTTFSDYLSYYRDFTVNILKKHGFDIEIPEDCGINFDYKIPHGVKESIEQFKISQSNNIILFNQLPRSGQTDSHSYGNYLVDISTQYPQYNFFYTNPESIDCNNSNLYFTPNIFGNYPCDILYNAYLSYFCKFIISRLSGPAMFSCMHTKNVSDPSKVLITQIHNDVELWYNKNIYRAENIRSISTQNSFEILNKFLSSQ